MRQVRPISGVEDFTTTRQDLNWNQDNLADIWTDNYTGKNWHIYGEYSAQTYLII